jgi:glycosyltransferase involved in cell wall biosynthesis
MKILHIANGYIGSKLYKLFFTQLSKYSTFQSVFIPIRAQSQYGVFNSEVKGIKTYYCLVVNSFFYRLFFNLKIRKEIRLLNSLINVREQQIIHAHSLFSDGAVAYTLYKKFSTPYIVVVRNTDINIFLKYFVHLRLKGKEIVRNAEKIVFLSKWYKTKLLNYYKEISEIIEQKSVVIPNGIDEFWYSDKPKKKQLKETVNFLFVGEIRKNKNIHGILKTLNKLSNKIKFNFIIVGEGLNDERGYLVYLKTLIQKKTNIKILKALPKEELIELYKDATIFIMPSFTESFGLVYAEALSQYLPIIYTQKEGFDGWFNPGIVGYPVDPDSYEDIANKILLILENYDKIQQNIACLGRYFSWDCICEKYYNLYLDILKR